MPETVLIVEDDPTMLKALEDCFQYHGYRVLTAADGEAGLELLLDEGPDIAILDIMLPKMNGYEVCSLARKEGIDLPIIMLTAKGQESDVCLGLEVGADDYVTKPFGIRELLARVRASLRRRHREEPDAYHFADWELNITCRRLRRNGADVPLTPKEFGLLAFLVRHEGRAFTRADILNAVWGYNVFVTERSVDRCVNTLRGKVESNPQKPAFIQTVRGIGYRFEPPEPYEDG